MLKYIKLRDMKTIEEEVAKWFCDKWGVPKEAYLKCMDDYLNHQTELGWYLCLDNDKIVGGIGAIENDFHDRKDLSPNLCALYVLESYRGKGIAGNLLNMAITDLNSKGISPIFLVTDHTSFYERYGWEFYTMVNNGESRLYIHK